ncbi:hypothetical protein D9M71_499980 [compost metagenome]
MPRDLKVFPGHGQGALHRTQLDVIAGRLGQQRQQHAAAVVLGDFDHGIGGFDLTPYPAPQIQLPTGGQIALPEIEGRLAALAGWVTETFSAVARAAVASVEIDRRGLFGSDTGTQRAALQQPRTGDLQVEVTLTGALDQGTEPGVIKALPPALLDRFGQGLARRWRFLQRRPACRCLAGRLVKVRAQGAAGQQAEQQRA